MLTKEERAWIEQLIHEAVREGMQAERKLLEAAIGLHEKGDDHIAFRAFIAREERNQEMWHKIKTSVVGALIIGTLYWVGSHAIEIAVWIVKNFQTK